MIEYLKKIINKQNDIEIIEEEGVISND